MKKTWILAAIAVLALLAWNLVATYNRLVALDEEINGKWAQVENQLQRRYDLIPNLVETVKGVTAQEQQLVKMVTDARARLAGARTVEERVAAANEVEGALARLLVVVENYPQLKSSESFQRLMDELAGTENRIATERMRYNEKVLEYNRTVRSFPMRFFASGFGFEQRAYFEKSPAAQETPKVKF